MLAFFCLFPVVRKAHVGETGPDIVLEFLSVLGGQGPAVGQSACLNVWRAVLRVISDAGNRAGFWRG